MGIRWYVTNHFNVYVNLPISMVHNMEVMKMVNCELCKSCKYYHAELEVCNNKHSKEMIYNNYTCKYRELRKS